MVIKLGKPRTERQKKKDMVKYTYLAYLGGIIGVAIVNPDSILIPIIIFMILGQVFFDPRIAFWKWGEIFGEEKFRSTYQPTNKNSSLLEYQPKG